MRLDKLLANYGIGTRKEVKSYIRKGFVEVNGEIIKKDDYKVDYQKDEIIFDGELIEYRPYVYLMLNKPKGYVSATKDNVHPTVIDLIVGYENYDLFPVGRLDIDTEGKFHQVKKMVEACNKKVTYLKRISIKGLTIDRSLQLGDFRELTKEEFIDLTKEL